VRLLLVAALFEAISKLWIAFDGNASADEKAEHTR
jgi:hypothetical protein